MTRVLHSRAIAAAIAVLLLLAAVLGYPVVRDNDAPRLHADPEDVAQVASGDEAVYRRENGVRGVQATMRAPR